MHYFKLNKKRKTYLSRKLIWAKLLLGNIRGGIFPPSLAYQLSPQGSPGPYVSSRKK